MTTAGLMLDVDRTCERVTEALDGGRHAWVVGDLGSGRSTLARALVQALGSKQAVWIDLLELDEADAIIAGLFGAAAHLGDADARSSCLRDWSSMQKATQALSAASDELTLVVTVPRGWSTRSALAEEPWEYTLARRAHAFLQGLMAPSLRVVLITTRDSRRPDSARPASRPRRFLGRAHVGRSERTVSSSSPRCTSPTSFDWRVYFASMWPNPPLP